MRAGELDRRISIERAVEAPDSMGQPVESWVQVARVWAKVEWKAGGESFDAAQRTARQDVEFTIRWRPLLDPKHRVIFEGRVYDIEDVRELDRREGLVLTSYGREVRPGGV